MRWTPKQKRAFLEKARADALSMEQITSEYGISAEEFEAWTCAFEKKGIAGLYVYPEHRLSRSSYQNMLTLRRLSAAERALSSRKSKPGHPETTPTPIAT